MRFSTKVFLLVAALSFGCTTASENVIRRPTPDAIRSDEVRKMLASAAEQRRVTTGYTQDYFQIPYPNGDVPAETGACTDVIIRSLRKAGVDLQQLVHEDMSRNPLEYPKKWGNVGPDTNIDHRRVPNLETYLNRQGKAVSVTAAAADYSPGDIVSWDLNGKGMTHIGIVADIKNERTGRYMIIHNIGAGVMAEDRIFDWKIRGHYRYFE